MKNIVILMAVLAILCISSVAFAINDDNKGNVDGKGKGNALTVSDNSDDEETDDETGEQQDDGETDENEQNSHGKSIMEKGSNGNKGDFESCNCTIDDANCTCLNLIQVPPGLINRYMVHTRFNFTNEGGFNATMNKVLVRRGIYDLLVNETLAEQYTFIKRSLNAVMASGKIGPYLEGVNESLASMYGELEEYSPCSAIVNGTNCADGQNCTCPEDEKRARKMLKVKLRRWMLNEIKDELEALNLTNEELKEKIDNELTDLTDGQKRSLWVRLRESPSSFRKRLWLQLNASDFDGRKLMQQMFVSYVSNSAKKNEGLWMNATTSTEELNQTEVEDIRESLEEEDSDAVETPPT